MKCVILQERMPSSSVAGRVGFFKSLLSLYFIEYSSNDTITLMSIPGTCEDVCFIVGHQNKVKDYLDRNPVTESIIVIISCDMEKAWNKYDFGEKEVFVCKQEEGKAVLYKKEEYSFDFDPTESELMIFNSPKNESFYSRIVNSFDKIQ